MGVAVKSEAKNQKLMLLNQSINAISMGIVMIFTFGKRFRFPPSFDKVTTGEFCYLVTAENTKIAFIMGGF